ncbi:protein F14D2.9 [Elysia marginata]|uniref:Protein F14D2.9 n=1 Tax=Elysia marginata TaxID=1093978 RepID=A0AAV4JVE6_9GAST|nr:protein F14D2.9 [Elysia marginata]
MVRWRFRCLHDELRLQPPGYNCQIILACFMLHNMAVRLNLPTPEDIDDDPSSAADDNDTTEAVPDTAHRREPELTVAGLNQNSSLVKSSQSRPGATTHIKREEAWSKKNKTSRKKTPLT